ncbi:hypothetical protein XENE109146_19515 [Xenorhabdus nematophila]
MLEIGFPQIEQALPGHGAVLDALLFRYQAEHRLHQTTLTRRTAALYQDGQRLAEFAAHRRQITRQQVG